MATAKVLHFVTFHATVQPLNRPADAQSAPRFASETEYVSMIETLFRSAARSNPGARFSIITTAETDLSGVATPFTRVDAEVRAAHLMLDRARAQRALVKRMAADEALVFIDSDILVVGELTHLLAHDFDVALTVRAKADMPFNGGLIVVNSAYPHVSAAFYQQFVSLYAGEFRGQTAWFGDQYALARMVGDAVPATISDKTEVTTRFGRLLLLPGEVYNRSPNDLAQSLAALKTARVLHFKGPRKVLMSETWAAVTGAPAPAPRYNCGEQKAATWYDRASICARLVAGLGDGTAPLKVADIGCGDEKLKDAFAWLNVPVDYRGFDIEPQRASVTAFDARADDLPDRVDAAALLGVIEYLDDAEGALRRVARRARHVVVTATTSDRTPRSPEDVARRGWINFLSDAEFEALARRAGLEPVERKITKDRKTTILLCRSKAATPAALSPYLMPERLRTKKAVNLGDGFILRAVERLFGPIPENRLFSTRAAPGQETIAELAQSRVVLIAGANQLHDAFAVWPGLTASEIDRLGLRFAPVGLGINGEADRNEAMSEPAKDTLRAIHRRIEFSSWRCPLTVAYLERELPDLAGRFLMTGCPTTYDAPLLESARFEERDDDVAVTITERGDWWERERATIDYVARRFPNARRRLVLHQDFLALEDDGSSARRLRQDIRTHAHGLGFEVAAPGSADEALAIYRGAGMHFGSRVHAHLTMLSLNRRSFLTRVDDRATGFAEALGFAISEPTSFDGDLSRDFEPIRQAARRGYVEMRRFVDALDRN